MYSHAMPAQYRFKTLTLITFAFYVFWGSFGVDITLNPGAERVALHRIFLFLTGFIFLFNAQAVIAGCFKNKLLIGLLLYVLLTAAWAFKPMDVVKNSVFLGSVMVISIMTVLAFTDNRISLIRGLFWLLLLMVLASIVTALVWPHIGIDFRNFAQPRWIGITAHPNGLGTQALSLIWFSVNLYILTKSKFERKIILLALAAGYFVLIKSNSMTSLVASVFLMGAVGYFYLLGNVQAGVKIFVLTIAFIVFLIVTTFYMSASELASSTLASTGRDTTLTGRSLLWEKGFEAASEQIVFGYGFDDLWQLTKKYHLQMSHLHNGYIETLVKGGMIAELLLLIILFKTYIGQLAIKRVNKQEYIFLNTGLIMVLLHNIAEASYLRGLSTLSVFLIFIVVSTSLQRNTINAKG